MRPAVSFRSLTNALLIFPLALLFSASGCSRSGGDGGGGDGDGDDGGVDQPEVEICQTNIEPVTDGVCAARGGSGPAVLLRGDVLGADTVYAGGEVLYSGDQIVCTGCDCSSAAGYAEAHVVECPEAVISPGLINPHDHITFTEGAPLDTGLTRYDHRHDWRHDVSTPGNAHGTGATSAGTRWGEIRMMLSGVTSMVGSGRANNLVRNLDQLAPAEKDRGLRQADFETFSLGDSNETFHPNCDWNYKLTESEAAATAAFLPHVAEGVNDYAAEEFRCQSTSFGGGQDFTESNDSFIHAIGLTAADYFKMARRGTRLIWSPRSNISLYGYTAAVTLFDRFGGTIALGTDWTYSGSANMLRELACADQLNQNQYAGHFSDRELWQMATINAAIATGNDTLLGSLEEGKLADISVYRAEPGSYYRGVIDAENADVALVVIGGQPMFGEPATLSALGESCDAIDVCGESRSICTTREFGTSYDALATEVAGGDRPAYQAIFCGPPPGEPSCVPFRNNQFTGMPTADDNDGDGLTNDKDNCPDIFNPIRPIDSGVQPDADGDGIGDVCDDDPLVADMDNDGVDNAMDNCPFDANGDQVDGDSDGRGDLCDFCPKLPNPDSVCGEGPAAPASVSDIQTGAVSTGTQVSVKGLVVTAVWGLGFYAQDPAGGAENSGISVFVGADPGVAVGDKVDVEGATTEFFDETEIDNATVTKLGAGTPITPVELTVAEAMDEKYEGTLVTLTDIGQVASPYDCSADNAGCADAALWLVNGSIAVYDRAYQDADWSDHIGNTPATGVMAWRFDRRRLLPRTTSDFGN